MAKKQTSAAAVPTAPEPEKTIIDLRPPAELMTRLEAFQADKPRGIPAPIMLAGIPVIPIETQEQRMKCADRHKAAHAMIKLITEDYENIKKPIRLALDTVQATMKKHLAGPQAVKEIMDRSITRFDAAEEDRKRREREAAERKLREEAEAKRLAEVKALEDAAKAAKDKEVKAALKEQAAAVKEAPVYVPPVPVAPKQEQKGSGTRKTFYVTVDDAEQVILATTASEFIRLAKASRYPDEKKTAIVTFLEVFLRGAPLVENLTCVEPNETKLNQLAGQFEKALNIPGVTVHERSTFTSRA